MRVASTEQGLLIEVTSEDETDRLGQALARVVEAGVVIGLTGPLGAGKTRLVRALCEALGVEPRAISSPTFVLIHEYEGHLPVYHFDVYRLGSPEDFDALGAADYWMGEGLCLIEWADRVADRLPRDAWMVRIEPTGTDGRRFHFSFPAGSKVPERLTQLINAV